MLRIMKYLIIIVLGYSIYATADMNNLSQESLTRASSIAKEQLSSQINAIETADDMASDQHFSRELAEHARTAENINVNSGIGFDLPNKYYKDFDKANLFQKIESAKNTKFNLNMQDGSNAPVVLVSFSMPVDSIKSLMYEMEKVGGAVVFRGLVENNIKKTIQAIQDIGGEHGGALIDPTLFERFNATQVPTFVIPQEKILPCTRNDKCVTPKHIKVAGDVSLAYVLDLIERTGNAEEKAIAEAVNAQLRQ